MKDPKLKNFTYAYYLKVTQSNGAKVVIQGWYRLMNDGTIFTLNGETFKKGWE